MRRTPKINPVPPHERVVRKPREEGLQQSPHLTSQETTKEGDDEVLDDSWWERAMARRMKEWDEEYAWYYSMFPSQEEVIKGVEDAISKATESQSNDSH